MDNTWLKTANLHYFCFEFMDEYYAFDKKYYYSIKISKRLFFYLSRIYKNDDIEGLTYSKELEFIYNFYNKDILLGTERVTEDECNIENEDYAVLSFAPIYACNFRCKYCFASSGASYQDDLREFTTELLIEVLNKFFFDLFPKKLNYRIEFVSGGEPLLNFQTIKTTIEYCEKIQKDYNKKISIWLCTNGSIYNDEYITFLDKHNVRIGVSVDGDKYSHNKNRIDLNGQGTYDSVINNYNKIIKNCSLSKSFRDIWGLSVISETNYDLTSIIKHHYDRNFNSVQLKLVRKKEHSLMFIENLKEQYNKLALFLLEEFFDGNTKYIEMILNDNDYLGKIILRIITGTKIVRRCQAGRNKITICPNGDIYPCDSFVGIKKMLIGNIFESDYRESEFTNYDVDSRIECNNCDYKDLCGGDCFYNSYINNGNIREPDKMFCNLNQHLCKLSIFMICEMYSKKPDTYEKMVKEVLIRESFKRK